MPILSIAGSIGTSNAVDDCRTTMSQRNRTPIVGRNDGGVGVHDVVVGRVSGDSIRQERDDIQGWRGSFGVSISFVVELVSLVGDLELAAVGTGRNDEVDKLEVELRVTLCN
jgi:hypothetical protein